MAKQTGTKPPWDRENPKQASGRKSKKMTGAQKGQARARAKQAGRPYPNLVDNMAATKGTKTKTKRKSTKKKGAKATKKKAAKKKATTRKGTKKATKRKATKRSS